MQIGQDRDVRVELTEFKGKHYVMIREFYEKDGEMLPGKKGINLKISEWNSLLKNSNQISSQDLEE